MKKLLSLLVFLAIAPLAHAYTPLRIHVSGTFNSSAIADPAQNRLAGLIGKTFDYTFIAQPWKTPTDISATSAGWSFPTTSTITIAGNTWRSITTVSQTTVSGQLEVPLTVGTHTYPMGTVIDSFSVNAWNPSTLGGGTTLSESESVVSGLNAEFAIAGLPGMLNGTTPYPISLPANSFVSMAHLELIENHQLVGEVRLMGTVSGSYANLSITPVAAVPEPETYAMLLAGLGVLGSFARRRKQR